MGKIIYSIEEIDSKKLVYIGYSIQKLRHILSKFVYQEPVDRRKKTALWNI